MTDPPSRPVGAGEGAPGPLECPTCGAEVGAGESFCEACGTRLDVAELAAGARADGQPGGRVDPGGPLESPISLSAPVQCGRGEADDEDTVAVRRVCRACGAAVGADGYCEVCGTKAPSRRDHYTEQPASWVAASCDRGVRHERNEDAVAVAAEAAPGSRAVLVVCDGVSTSTDSDVASLAAARAARDVLAASRPKGLGTPTSRVAAVASALERAAEEANQAVIANTAPDSANAASCTFAAAVLETGLVVYGNVGDSRVYWLPDSGEARLLTLDDSLAQLRIDSGSSRQAAEAGPQAHAITKWLGRDSPDHTPTTGSIELPAPGWVMVCSDGLWNYASEPAALQALIGERAGISVLALAEALVEWACDRGGKDNITVALARHD